MNIRKWQKVMETDQVLTLSVGASQLISVICEKTNLMKRSIICRIGMRSVRKPLSAFGRALDHLHEAGPWRVYSTPVSFRLSETGSPGVRCPQRYHILFVLGQLHFARWGGRDTCHYV